MSKNSIEYNLTNKLFTNCRKRFIIDINDNEDVQITSCIENKDKDNHYLINLEDGDGLPKELKSCIRKGKKAKFQFRTYSLNKKEEDLRDAIKSLFDENMSTRFEQSTSLINHVDRFNFGQRQTRSATFARRLVGNQSENNSLLNQTTKSTKKTAKKSIPITKKATPKKIQKKRALSTNRDEEQTSKRRKVADNQNSTGNKRVTGRSCSKSRARKSLKSRNNSKARKGKKTALNKNKTILKSKTSTKKAKEKSIELIDLLESSVESEIIDCSQDNTDNADERIRSAVDQIADYILSNENQRNLELTTNQQLNTVNETEIQADNRTNNQGFKKDEIQSNLVKFNNQDEKNQISSRVQEEPQQELNYPLLCLDNQISNNDEVETPSFLQKKKKIDYSELKKRVNRLKEQNELSNETIIKNLRLNKKLIETSNSNQPKSKIKQTDQIYQLNDNLVSLGDKLGQKHLITCLTVILIGEITHYMQSNLNYDQLPIGCLLINNLISSVQITILGHFIYTFTNLIIPNFFNFIKTSSRLICYSLLLFLSYGMLRKTLTNWILNNNCSSKLFPLNVALCSLMLLLYSLSALWLSTDGDRIIQKKERIQDNLMAEEFSDEFCIHQDNNCQSEKSNNWLNSIAYLLTPYLMISPIIGSHVCRLYSVPKLILILGTITFFFGLYKYIACRLERSNFQRQKKLIVYQLKPDFYLFSNPSSRIRFSTFFGVLLMITAYNLLVLNLWSFLLQVFTILNLKLKSRNLDAKFSKINKSIYTRYKSNNPYLFIPYIH